MPKDPEPTPRPHWLGDEVTPLVETTKGEVLLGIRADGSLFHYGRDGRVARALTFTDPMNLGNAWMAMTDGDGTVRYMSDQWDGRVCGYEKRDLPPYGDVHIAQTHATAIGIIAFGGGSMMVRREIQKRYPWHHLFADYSAAQPRLGADATAACFLRLQDDRRHALPTVFCANLLFGSGLLRDTAENSPRLEQAAQAARDMAARSRRLGKELWIDRLLLSLFEGQTDTTLGTASYEYGMAMRRLRAAVVAATGQPQAPVCIVSQSAGGRADGTSPVILAEAQLDIDHWSLGAVVATPKYHLPLEDGTHSTLTAKAACEVSEMEALAADAVLNARQWYCPRMTHARYDGTRITAHFMANNDQHLVLDDPGQHGFALEGDTGGAQILAVAAEGLAVQLTLDREPTGPFRLCYAFGQTGDRGDGLPANRGCLRDNWSRPALHDPAVTLYRRALSTRVDVLKG